jgi:hypothetical protein
MDSHPAGKHTYALPACKECDMPVSKFVCMNVSKQVYIKARKRIYFKNGRYLYSVLCPPPLNPLSRTLVTVGKWISLLSQKHLVYQYEFKFSILWSSTAYDVWRGGGVCNIIQHNWLLHNTVPMVFFYQDQVKIWVSLQIQSHVQEGSRSVAYCYFNEKLEMKNLEAQSLSMLRPGIEAQFPPWASRRWHRGAK